MKLSLAGAFLASLESGWITAQMQTVDGGRMDYLDMVRASTECRLRIPWINACVFKLNIMRISHLEVFIGASVGSTSSRSWISGTDPAIATSKSEDTIVACISSSSTKSATNGS